MQRFLCFNLPQVQLTTFDYSQPSIRTNSNLE